ncbi:RagB/SusD family nutrient uptake outer membrane protein [Pedobacter miscanthi]|uniref:RagB/SusD family nutrient uptake outer membrane protein n=1 Tax=Pedobacter miscanthi TaxID=2259170 RepID=UPI00292E5A45|nr:RagB/SusD family nutrient uptake outer membrane protein [Pedobacter miscanthi]
MKNQKINFIYMLACCLAFTGCDKYLDITPKGKTLLSTVDNYDQFLNDDKFFQGATAPSAYTYLNILSDNYDFVTVKTPAIDPTELVYTWSLQFTTDINSSPPMWGDHYGRINLYNSVLAGIDNATGGSAAKKRSIKAEALLGRALEYFYLVNEYGKPYDGATAQQDPGVPFVTSNDVSQKVPGRSSVAEIHQHIIDDVNSAIADLPSDNSANRLRGSKAAGYSVLARTYFYMRNYPEARRYAELALSNTKAVMINFNAALPATNFISIHPDVIYGRIFLPLYPAQLDFMRSFATNDLRVRKLYSGGDGYTFTTRGATLYAPVYISPTLQYGNPGTSVQEMKLTIAECAARSGDLTEALTQLNDIRRNRFSNYTDYSSSDQTAVLDQVFLERRHEIPFNGLRWFDMRRLDKENRMGTVTRYNAQNTAIVTLPPHSNRYTLQIPFQVISFNPDMQQNP